MAEEDKPQKYELFNVDFSEYKTKLSTKFLLRKPYKPANPKKIISFIPGTIRKVYIKQGAKVKAGDKLLVLEAMKMKNDIITTINGKVKKILVSENDIVANKQLLIELQ
jgi:biotin carboxyl carrier protein